MFLKFHFHVELAICKAVCGKAKQSKASSAIAYNENYVIEIDISSCI